jgi:5'-nucleotidase
MVSADSGKIALVDLDGSVADYDQSLTRIMNSIRHPDEPEYMGRSFDDRERPYIEARRKLIQSQPGFWSELPELKLGFDLVQVLREIGYSLHILTKGPRSTTSAWSEKVKWASQHLPDAKITISEDKSLVYGRVLIDDYMNYAIPWLEKRPRGVVIAVAQPWNKDAIHDRVFRYDGTNLEKMREILQKAYDR